VAGGALPCRQGVARYLEVLRVTIKKERLDEPLFCVGVRVWIFDAVGNILYEFDCEIS